ncbi:MAG: ABC transporter permease [Acidimicrobiales bacterium]
MKIALIVGAIAVLVVVRFAIWRAKRRRRTARKAAVSAAAASDASQLTAAAQTPRWNAVEAALGDVGLVAGREIRERLRGRIFRVGTIVMLLAVGAAVVIPALHKNSSGPTLQKVGIVGTLSPVTRELVLAAAQSNNDKVQFVPEASVVVAKSELKSGASYFSIIDSREVLLYQPATASSSPADPGLVDTVAEYLGVVIAYRHAHLTPAQAATVTNSQAVPIRALVGSSKSAHANTTSIIGIVLLFYMLTQYCTWILIGVMQEKSSRVVEVLLAMVRPVQLLGGKVLGIGLVALGQALLLVGFALALGAGVGSDLLRGTAPLALLAELAWLVLGYAFYCWVYAAAGSTAERQDQVQTLALPLSIPVLFAYIYSITVASSGTPNAFFDVLAYLPPTAPFCMSVLVGLGKATWWEFLASALISIASTAGMAIFASRIYRRAVLRTGGRVGLRDLLYRRAG